MSSSQKRQTRSKPSPEANQTVPQEPSAAFEVTLSRAAEAAYERFYKRAAEARDRGEATSYHFTALNMIDEALERIIPNDPFNKRFALQGDLSGLFRLKKGRMRICWVGNSVTHKVCVIFISETARKDGDANDPYSLVTKMVLSGQCDEIFVGLGLPAPSKFSRGGERLTLQ